MSNDDLNKSEDLDNDLEHVALNVERQESPFSEKEHEAEKSTAASEQDRSLANLHTGSGREYEEPAILSPEEGMRENDQVVEQKNEENQQKQVEAEAEQNVAREENADFSFEQAETVSLNQSDFVVPQNETQLGDLLPPTEQNQTEEENSQELQNASQEEAIVLDATEKTESSGDIAPNEAPHSVALDDNTVDENSAVGTVVGTVSADDLEGDTLSYSLSDDAGGMFTIDPNSGEIKVAGALDHEAQDSYSVTVDVFDGEHTTQQTFAIDVGDVNEAAHSVALDDNTVDENSAVGTVVGTVTADDPEGDTLSYSLSDDAGGMFTIDPNSGEIKVAGALDHEVQDSYSVTVDVFDGEHTTQQTFTIDVGDVNEAAHSVALDDNTVDENSAVGTVVGTVTADDPEGDTLSYSLSDDAGGMFTIDPNSGEIKVAGSLDHEAQDSYSVTVDVFDGEHTTQQTFTIDVGDVNEAAHSVALDDNSVDENSAVGTVVGTVTADDPEGDTLSYSLSDDAGGMFTIDPNSGEIKVAGALDHEAQDSYSVTVDVFDGEHTTQQTFTIDVGDVNEAAHSVALDDNSVDENSAVGTVVGTVTADDPEGDILSYSLSDDAGGMFTIDPNSGEIKVAGALDHEAQDSYSVTVDVFDGEHTTQQTFTIDVGDVNEAAHSVALDDNSVDENSAVGTVVGTVTADDPEGDTLSYSLSDDAGGMFTIDPNSGEIKVAGSLDHEAQDSYSVTVDVFDGEHTTQQTFTIDVGDLAAPTVTGTGNTIAYADMDEVVDLSHMDQFPELYEGSHLEDRVGTEVFDDMVDDAEKLVINYQSEATVTFKGETAGYRNSIGAYQINEDGTIQDVQLLWGDASSDKLTIGESQATYTGIEQGSELGFFVISNGFGKLPDGAVSGDGNTISETGTWMFVSPDFDPATQNPSDHQYNVNTDSGPPQMIYVEGDGTIHTQSGNVFHSLRQEDFNPDASVDSREHFVAGVDSENGVLHFGIEDLMGGGDADFDDTMFSVEIDARDLVETPNPLFAQDEVGRSTFQITDTDSTDLSDATVVVGDIQTGDSLTIGGGYQLNGGVVELPDGNSTGISYSIVEDGSNITLTLTGTASVDLYESIIQSVNFSNDGSAGDAAGDRTIEVDVTDSSGEASEVLSTSIRVATNSDTYTATANSDEYYGDGADETIEGAGGDDYLHGGGGDDVLHGGAGDDEVYGGEGSDIFHFASDEGNDAFYGGEGSGWSDTIVLTDGMPAGDVSDWLTLTSGSIESTASGEIFLSEDAAGTISLDGGNAVLTFEGVEKIEA